MLPAHCLDDTFIRAKSYISPKKVALKKILKCKLINDIIYEFSVADYINYYKTVKTLS